MTLGSVAPIAFASAKQYVARWHRHSRVPVGHLFSLSVVGANGFVCGVAIVGRPVSRHLDDGDTVEITRVATDGTRNACSRLYGAAVREAYRRGYSVVVTYTREDESGASLRGAGATAAAASRGGQWSCATRPRHHDPSACPRVRWEWRAKNAPPGKNMLTGARG